MIRWASLAAAAVLCAVTAACGGDESAEPTGDPGEVAVELEARHDSNAAGVQALLTWKSDSRTEITVEGLDPGEPAGGGRHPAHVHRASCADGGAVAYALEPLASGTSTTTVEAGLDELLSGRYSVDVHLGMDDDEVVACGDLPEQAADEG
jgi:hypothetical protein